MLFGFFAKLSLLSIRKKSVSQKYKRFTRCFHWFSMSYVFQLWHKIQIPYKKMLDSRQASFYAQHLIFKVVGA